MLLFCHSASSFLPFAGHLERNLYSRTILFPHWFLNFFMIYFFPWNIRIPFVTSWLNLVYFLQKHEFFNSCDVFEMWALLPCLLSIKTKHSHHTYIPGALSESQVCWHWFFRFFPTSHFVLSFPCLSCLHILSSLSLSSVSSSPPSSHLMQVFYKEK